MARGDQLARQWKIIQTLISSREGRSAAELASDLDCHPRTVYRDLEALQTAGFPIYSERVNGNSLWSLLDTVKHQIPIPFSLTELMALYFSTDMLKVFKETVFYDSLESLSRKIRTTLPPESYKYIEKVEQTLHVGSRPYKEYGKFKEIINRVNEAALKKKSVEMVYHTISRQKDTRRKVDPYQLWFSNGTFYLIGYCHFRQEVRVFAVDRIKILRQTEHSFEIPGDFNPEEFMRLSFGVFHGKRTKVKIWFAPELAPYIMEKVWHESQVIHRQDDGSIIFEAEVAGTRDMKFWVMSWGSKAVVLEPESLRDKIQAEAEAMAGRYGDGDRLPVTGDR